MQSDLIKLAIFNETAVVRAGSAGLGLTVPGMNSKKCFPESSTCSSLQIAEEHMAGANIHNNVFF